MTDWVILDGAGALIVAKHRSETPPAGAIACPEAVPFEAALAWYWDGAAWAERPRLTLTAPHAGAPYAGTFTGLPEGTVIEVIDVSGAESLGETTVDGTGVAVISLPDPGRYALEFAPPAPWMPETFNVISEAAP